MTSEQHQALVPLLRRLAVDGELDYYTDDPDRGHLLIAVYLTPDQWLRIKEAFQE